MPGKAPRLPSTNAAETGSGRGTTVSGIVAAWRGIVSALVPVIGERGVAALIDRSVQDASRQVPWLESASARSGLDELERLFAARSEADVQAAHAVLLAAFVDLLEHLVGRELARRLLETGIPHSDADDA